MQDLTPRQIVAELDKFIVGQDAAKRAVAVALRNRVRRGRVSDDMPYEITPKSIINYLIEQREDLSSKNARKARANQRAQQQSLGLAPNQQQVQLQIGGETVTIIDEHYGPGDTVGNSTARPPVPGVSARALKMQR